MFQNCIEVSFTTLSLALPPSLPSPHLSPAIHGKEHASTKKLVGNALALNLVRQLYHLRAIEAARAPGTKKPADIVSNLTLSPSPSPSLLPHVFAVVFNRLM